MNSLGRALAEVADEQETQEFNALEHEPAVASSSVLAAARARAAQLRDEKTVDLPIPGYENVIGRYRAVALTDFNRMQGNELHVPFLDWRTAADALATALEGIYGVTDDGDVVPLYGDGPCILDDELIDALDLHVADHTARAVLVALCGGGGGGQTRVWQHFLTYQAWLTEGPAQEVAADAVGES